jgi:ABC-type branched-subunit amino acid transport system ATPase component
VTEIRSPAQLRKGCDRLIHQRDTLRAERDARAAQRKDLAGYLDVADAVTLALETLGEQLFGDIIKIIETQLSRALEEVLEQPLALKVERQLSRGTAALQFHVERNGQREDIMRGMGGSVANVLSVGLRLLALHTLDPQHHRRFLVLDEPDCWLAPALVPRLVHMIHEAGKKLGFQVLLISHHDVSSFERYADRIYQCVPENGGTALRQIGAPSDHGDPPSSLR